jgi:glutaredoxin
MGADVKIYTRPGCLFCHRVVSLLSESGIQCEEIEIVEVGDQERMLEKYSAVSFPLVFVRDRYIGGYSHLVLLHSQGRLSEILERPSLHRISSSPAGPPSSDPKSWTNRMSELFNSQKKPGS